MHRYTKEVLMPFVKKEYANPERMTVRDLQLLKMWGDAMTSILCADLKYHEIDKMEHEEDWDDVSGEELLAKFKEIYNSSDSSTQTSWRAMINKIIA